MQILRIGQFIILVVPTEMTTMAGRRLRERIKARLVAKGVVSQDAVVVIAGLGNAYADYTTTFEEYQQQRYEGASTIYGPHQLNAYIQEFTRLADAMASGETPQSSEPPVDFSHHLGKGKTYDTDHLPKGAKLFGQVMADTQPGYAVGETARVKFAAGNPLNNLRPQGTFCEVQKCVDQDCATYQTVAEDGDWETRITIQKHKSGVYGLRSTSRVLEVSWEIPNDAEAGFYRIAHNGTYYKKGKFTDYFGVSSVFSVKQTDYWVVDEK